MKKKREREQLNSFVFVVLLVKNSFASTFIIIKNTKVFVLLNWIKFIIKIIVNSFTS